MMMSEFLVTSYECFYCFVIVAENIFPLCPEDRQLDRLKNTRSAQTEGLLATSLDACEP